MTARTRARRRSAFTLVEVLAVMAILILLAAVVLPSVGAFRGDSRPGAAADAIRAEVSNARGRAVIENRPYRVALTTNGTRIRRGPDGPDFATATATDHADGTSSLVEYELEHVTATVAGTQSTAAAADGTETVAVVLPNGTCLDDNLIVEVRETGTTATASSAALRVHIRGLTGSSRVLTGPPGGTQ